MTQFERPGRERGRIRRDHVARTALAVVDRDGLEALSMRGLADELGVGTMTLYGHFASKSELLAAVVDAAVEEFRLPDLAGLAWREGLRAIVLAVRAWLLSHPALVRLRGDEPILRPAAFEISERALVLLLDAGFEPAEAARAFRLLFTYAFGGAALRPADPSDQDRRTAHAALVALPPERFPALTAAAAGMADALGGEEQFAYGLERILDGLEARLSATAAEG